MTAAGKSGLSWVTPTSDGGSPLLDYSISYQTGSGAFTVLVSNVTETYYTAYDLVQDIVYTFKV